MATVDTIERQIKAGRTIGNAPREPRNKPVEQGAVQPDYNTAVWAAKNAPAAVASSDTTWMNDPKYANFVAEGKAKGAAGSNLTNFVLTRALGGADFSGFGQPLSNPKTGKGAASTSQSPLMSALTEYAKNMGSNTGMDSINSLFGQLLTDTKARGQSEQDAINQFYGGAETQLSGLNTDALKQLEDMYAQISGEISTQSEAGRGTIDEATQRALAALGGQSNPYANLQMMSAPDVSDPMAAYSQAVGAPTGGIDALQAMLQSQNAATGGGFNNLAQLLGASQQSAQQSRIGDVNVARAGAQQDLASNQRLASLQALQQSQAARTKQQNDYAQQMQGLGQNRLQSMLQSQGGLANLLSQLSQGQLQAQLAQQGNTQGRQDQLMQQLLGFAGQGVDISKIMALLGGG